MKDSLSGLYKTKLLGRDVAHTFTSSFNHVIFNNHLYIVGRRRGLVVRAVDYGVGDPQFKSFPQEKLLLLK